MTQATLDVQAIATISYDDSINGLTQPYIVKAGKDEVFRHATYAGCERFMEWHGYELALTEQEIAQAELEQHIEEQVQANSLLPSAFCPLPSIEIDSAEDGDFGPLYRLWKSYHFLGSFYQNLDGLWIAQPANSDCRSECDTEYQAQLVILAIQGLVVPIAA